MIFGTALEAVPFTRGFLYGVTFEPAPTTEYFFLLLGNLEINAAASVDVMVHLRFTQTKIHARILAKGPPLIYLLCGGDCNRLLSRSGDQKNATPLCVPGEQVPCHRLVGTPGSMVICQSLVLPTCPQSGAAMLLDGSVEIWAVVSSFLTTEEVERWLCPSVAHTCYILARVPHYSTR